MKSQKNKEQLDKVLLSFKQNKFDPKLNTEHDLPDGPGNYLICLRPKSKLFNGKLNPSSLKRFNNMSVIYTGISNSSLRSRDFKQHFTGNNAGRSTLRKSLGVLMGFKLEKRDVSGENNRTKFSQNNEKKLTEWMCQNLIMFYYETANSVTLENELIDHFNPPLNLSKNKNSENFEFRKELSALRNKKVKEKSTSTEAFNKKLPTKEVTFKKERIIKKKPSVKIKKEIDRIDNFEPTQSGCMLSFLAILIIFIKLINL